METEENGSGMAGLPGFPNEVLVLILQLLDLESLLKCHNVCKSWRTYSLYDANYLTHVLHAYTQLTYGTRPLPANLSGPEKSELLKHLFNTSVSALPVFAGCKTLRDIAVMLHQLEQSWLAGSNASFAQLNLPNVHQMPITSVAVDSRGGSIVTSDSAGVIAFWDATTGALRTKTYFSFASVHAGARVVPLQIVIENDIMVIGTPVGGVVVAVRDAFNNACPFSRVTEFWTASRRVTSIRMEGHICIVGEFGAVSFWNLGLCFETSPFFSPMQNPSVPLLMTIDTTSDSTTVEVSPSYSLFYRESLLFLGLAGSQIQQIGAHSKHNNSAKKQLWEADDYTYASFASGPAFEGRREWGSSYICPIGSSGDIVVSWPDCSIYRLGSEMEEDHVWEPKSERLIPPVPGRQSRGVFVRGDHIICRFMPYVLLKEIDLFSADGAPLGKLPCRYGAIKCMAVDPAFIVIGTGEASVCVYYFTKMSQWSSNGQGPSSPTASNVLQSPVLERGNTYKRKYNDAMGFDAETPAPIVARSGSIDYRSRIAVRPTGAKSLAPILNSELDVRAPVPAP